MMYNNKFVAAIKSGGKVLREFSDVVYLPVGSEYSILLKNLSSTKAVASVHIDGTDVLKGRRVILGPNEEVELERFVESLDKGDRFKFIEKTQKISDYRGDKVDDGIVRIEFQFEKEKPVIPVTWSGQYLHDIYVGDSQPRYGNGGASCGSTTATYSSTTTYQSNNRAEPTVRAFASASCSTGRSVKAAEVAEVAGITVRGSESNQSFTVGTIGDLEYQRHTLVFRLQGTKGEVEVAKPITVTTKLKCNVCGTVSDSTIRFCPECGNHLV